MKDQKIQNSLALDHLSLEQSYHEVIEALSDNWSVVNDHERRIKRLETLLLDLKFKLEEKQKLKVTRLN